MCSGTGRRFRKLAFRESSFSKLLFDPRLRHLQAASRLLDVHSENIP
jgi:hypothetical protein